MHRADNDNNVPDLEIGNIWEPIRNTIKQGAEYTQPNVSIGFFVLLAAGAYFHQSHFFPTVVAMGIWLVLQLLNNAMDEDYRNDLFWGILGTVGYIFVYVLFGYLWSFPKLFIDISRKHLEPALMAELSNCQQMTDGQFGCYVAFLGTAQPLLHQWAITWPMSILYTVTNDPLAFFTGFLIEWSQAQYIWVIETALSSNKSFNIGWYFVFGFAYFAIGYAWTHVKLFLDVWQGTLPKKLDAQVRAVYEQQESYWQFIIDIKWMVLQWMIMWPFSMIFTFFRHPFRMVADFLYKLSQRKYVWLTEKAMEWRHAEIKEE